MAITTSTASLEKLIAYTQQDLCRVNDCLLASLRSEVPLIDELARHVISAGGKRLRPMLTLAAATLFGYDGARHVELATCVELIHTATLLHDDVVDESTLRRGMETANAIWGNKASVLVGDFLFSRAFQLMVRDGNLRVLKILSDTSATLAQGEVLQLSVAGNLEIPQQTYFDVISCKTAALFAAATEVGAVISQQDDHIIQSMRDYGHNLGMVFQIVDDVLDYNATSHHIGKSIGDDFAEGKITLPVLLAYARGKIDERGFWQRTLSEREQKPSDFGDALHLMQQHDVFAQCLSLAAGYAARARDALVGLPASHGKDVLMDTLEFSLTRGY